jgi:hypothetical protein
MKTEIKGFEFELREFTIMDREILENECYKIVDGYPEIKTGTTKKYALILGCKSAPFFTSVISESLGVTKRIINEREKEYYNMDKKYYDTINDLVIAINNINKTNTQEAEDIAKK